MKYLLSILIVGSALAPLQARAGDAPQAPAFDPTPSYSGLYIRGDFGGSYLALGNTSSPTNYVGDVGIGYAFDQNFRTDLTFNTSGNYGINPSGSAYTNLLLGNVYYDFRNQSAFTPYIGAGVGYGWEWSNSPGISNVQGVAVGLAAGVAYDFNRNLALDVGYRFHDILNGNQSIPEHQVAVGLRVKF